MSDPKNVFAEAGMNSNLGPSHIKAPCQPADFLPPETSFWCSVCDGGPPVKADDSSTGQLFAQFGHPWIPQKQLRDDHDKWMVKAAERLRLESPDSGHVGHEYIQGRAIRGLTSLSVF